MNKKHITIIILCVLSVIIYLFNGAPSINKGPTVSKVSTPQVDSKLDTKDSKKNEVSLEQAVSKKEKKLTLINNSYYRVLTEQRAVRKSDFKGNSSDIIEEKSGYIIYKATISDSPLSFDEFTLPVLFNEDTGSAAILTGKIIIKTNYPDDIKEIEQKTKMYLEIRLKKINRYILNAQNEKNIFDSYNKLKQTNQFSEVELEIIDSSISPK